VRFFLVHRPCLVPTCHACPRFASGRQATYCPDLGGIARTPFFTQSTTSTTSTARRSWPPFPIGGGEEEEEEEEEERDLINDLKRHGRLAVAWDRHGSPVPRWTLTRLDNTPTLLALSLEEEEEEEEERLYLQLETRERVQTNEAKSKRRRASPT
jgi:hypothetical protein